MKHNAKHQQGLSTVRRLLLLQLGLTLLIVAVNVVLYSTASAISALLGGLVCVIPNALFGRMAFKYRGARAARQIVSSFYKGEALKILLTVILYIFVFVSFSVVPLAFFLTYILVQFSHWLLPLVLANKRIG